MMEKQTMFANELSQLLEQKYKELKEIEKALVEKQKEIRELKKKCTHSYTPWRVRAVDVETGVCRICKQKVEW